MTRPILDVAREVLALEDYNRMPPGESAARMIKRLDAAPALAREVLRQAWQPIETAPRGSDHPYGNDLENCSTWIIVWNGRHVGRAYGLVDGDAELHWIDECGEQIEPEPICWRLIDLPTPEEIERLAEEIEDRKRRHAATENDACLWAKKYNDAIKEIESLRFPNFKLPLCAGCKREIGYLPNVQWVCCNGLMYHIGCTPP